MAGGAVGVDLMGHNKSAQPPGKRLCAVLQENLHRSLLHIHKLQILMEMIVKINILIPDRIIVVISG